MCIESVEQDVTRAAAFPISSESYGEGGSTGAALA